MNEIRELVTELSARLPELQWKMNDLIFSKHSLPPGLFQTHKDWSGLSCIEEIKADLQLLASKKQGASAHYLAERIKQKINVLVTLCQINYRKQKPSASSSFGLTMLATRQEWLQSLEEEVHRLSIQQQALKDALAQTHLVRDASAELNLKAELGAAEKRLTLAQEALNKARG